MYAGHGQVEKTADESCWIEGVPRRESSPPPALFRHEDALQEVVGRKRVGEEYLINKINYMHFMGKKAMAALHHPRYKATILVRVSPEPCNGKEILCRWSDASFQGNSRAREYSIKHLVIEDQHNLLVVPAHSYHMIENGFGVNLPCECYISGRRKAQRFSAPEIEAEILQDGWTASGAVVDFSPKGVRLKVKPVNASSLHWFNCEEPVVLNLKRQNRLLFSGQCNCIRQTESFKEKEIVLIPPPDPIRRFPRNQTRNPRQQLVPPPVVSFVHPLLNRRVSFTVYDISTSGMCIYESPEEANLLQGLIIPELTIEVAGGVKMNCTAQVIYRSEVEDKGIKCGLAILDMDITSYSRLSHILSNAMDIHSYVSKEVEMDALWEFFFSSGFIYSSKYKMINNNKDSFKDIYKKLYNEHPEIARHFTYQDNGRIYGHISIIRAYARTWMIHHHAAVAHDKKRAGFIVLKQLMHNLNDMHRLPSARMDYVLCYYRPENEFPARVFGGFAEELKDITGCSVDSFAYLPYTRLSLNKKMPPGWTLEVSTEEDLWELQRVYANRSGGLLLKALGLDEDAANRDKLHETYSAIGLKRRWRSYSLCEHGILKAVIVANESDFGINLSELLNCIQTFAVDPEGLPWSVLSVAVGRLTAGYQGDKVPLMFYPCDYAKSQNIPYEKEYVAWVLNCAQGNRFMEYMQRRFRVRF